MNIEEVLFRPIDRAPSLAEETTYNVFTRHSAVGETFIGYVTKEKTTDCWVYIVDGTVHSDGYVDRCELFQLIKDDPEAQARG